MNLAISSSFSTDEMGGFIVSNQFTYNSGYNDYGLSYHYPNNQRNFYQNAYAMRDELPGVPGVPEVPGVPGPGEDIPGVPGVPGVPEVPGVPGPGEDIPGVPGVPGVPGPGGTPPPVAPPVGTVPARAVNVVNGVGSGFFNEGSRVDVVATPPAGYRFLNWTVVTGGVTLANANNAHTYFTLGNQDVVVRANLEEIPTTTTPTPVRVGDLVTVNSGVRNWATGEGMPSWVHGRTYPVIEIRTRNGVTELLLGNGINSWIRATDITKASETTPPIQINDQVVVNSGVRNWATGEGMPSWVHGRTYPVIEIRTRSGVTELLLGNGINSWIRATDVAKSSGSSNNPIQINNRVRVNSGVRNWATGEGMPSWVHGRIYPVVEIRTRSGVTELLLGDINSWIRQVDVTRV